MVTKISSSELGAIWQKALGNTRARKSFVNDQRGRFWWWWSHQPHRVYWVEHQGVYPDNVFFLLEKLEDSFSIFDSSSNSTISAKELCMVAASLISECSVEECLKNNWQHWQQWWWHDKLWGVLDDDDRKNIEWKWNLKTEKLFLPLLLLPSFKCTVMILDCLIRQL